MESVPTGTLKTIAGEIPGPETVTEMTRTVAGVMKLSNNVALAALAVGPSPAHEARRQTAMMTVESERMSVRTATPGKREPRLVAGVRVTRE
jgi:hypothetical protein